MFSCHQNGAEEKPRQKEGRGRHSFILELSYLYLSNTSRVAQAL